MDADDVRAAKINEGDMLKEGATIAKGDGHLVATEPQIERAKEEMRRELLARDLHRHWSSEDARLVAEILDQALNDPLFEVTIGDDAKRLKNIQQDLYESSDTMWKLEEELKRTA